MQIVNTHIYAHANCTKLQALHGQSMEHSHHICKAVNLTSSITNCSTSMAEGWNMCYLACIYVRPLQTYT